jgi:uncharacterized protein (TIGR02594 family)
MANLPDKFKFLNEIGVLPKMVSAALQYLGIKEIPGSKSNPVILDMAKGLGIADIYKDDDISWCALFINHLMRITGKPLVDVKKDKYNYLRAKYMLNWGNIVPKGEEKLGDILIFDREGGGHVGIYIADSDTTFYVCGGNQSNSVSIMELSKSRLLGTRRYYSIAAPESAKKYHIDSTGHLSTNEA